MAKKRIKYAVKLPKKGDVIYFSCNPEYGTGGKAKVSEVVDHTDTQRTHFVEVEQLPGVSTRWDMLAKEQEELKAKYGDTVARSRSTWNEIKRLEALEKI